MTTTTGQVQMIRVGSGQARHIGVLQADGSYLAKCSGKPGVPLLHDGGHTCYRCR